MGQFVNLTSQDGFVVPAWVAQPDGSYRRHGAEPGAPTFSELWRDFVRNGRNARLLTAIGIGAAGFAMQDALLEPYGGEILKLSVGATTGLTGAWALGSLIGFTASGAALASAAPVRWRVAREARLPRQSPRERRADKSDLRPTWPCKGRALTSRPSRALPGRP